MRAVQDALAVLVAAADLPLDPDDQRNIKEMTGWLMPEALDFDLVRFFPGSETEAEILNYMKGLSRYFQA